MLSTAAQSISENSNKDIVPWISSHELCNRHSQKSPLISISAGEMEYRKAITYTEQLVNQRSCDEIDDTLLFLSHPECISIGTREGVNNLLVSREFLEQQQIPIHKAVRGGNITYHWPGQMICFPIIKLQKQERDVVKYMWGLEETVIRTLHELGLEAGRRKGLTGVWIDDRKISPMGVRISRWVTSHGFAINVEGDLSPYEWMNPCGVEGMKFTSLERLGISVSREELIKLVEGNFSSVFSRDLRGEESNMRGGI